MSDNANRLSFHAGLARALEALDALAGTYERAAIAGSLRRGAERVGDVELVLRPAWRDGTSLLEARVADLLRRGVAAPRRKSNGALLANGPRYKALTFRGLALDLFVVQPDRHWGPTMLIRTGPGDANQVLVTPSGIANRDGLRGVLPRGLRFADGALWDGDQVLHTPEEEHVLAACGLPWIPPHERTVETYQQLASGRKYTFVQAPARWEPTRDAVYREGRPVRLAIPAPVPAGGLVEQMGLF